MSDSMALRDQLADDGRGGAAAVIRKEHLGGFIEGSLLLNSQVTADRNPGGAPHIALDPDAA